jgi:uncharacterized protein (TIGR03000 family)
MRRFRMIPLLVLSLLLLQEVASPPAYAVDPYISPDGVPYSNLGGIIVYRLGNQNITSIGGGPIPRHVWTTTTVPPPPPPPAIPFKMPGAAADGVPPRPNCSPALVKIGIPDPNGIVYIDGELYRSDGTTRRFQSPPLPLGQSYPLRVRAAFKVGDQLLIEDKQVLIQPAVENTITFDGSRAMAVPLTPQPSDLPFPRPVKE